jgi:hypothetical protein
MAEAYALTNGLAGCEWTFSLLNGMYLKNFELRKRDKQLSNIKVQALMAEPEHKEIRLLAIMDAKSLYDNLMKEATSQGEKRAAIEVVIARESLDVLGGIARWVPHELNIVDCLSKLKGNRKSMIDYLKRAQIRLQPEEEIMAEREKFRQETGKYNPRPKAKE